MKEGESRSLSSMMHRAKTFVEKTITPDKARHAPGSPGAPPRWTSSSKVGVGTAQNSSSKVWFTISHGILNEIFFPCVDQACTRDMGLIVTDGKDFFSEEKRHTDHQIAYMAEGVPAYRLTNTCKQQRYRIEKEIIIDPLHEAVLQSTRFVPVQGSLEDYHLYVLLAPHLGNRGYGNTAWVGEHKGVPMLFAQQGDRALALACSRPWLKRSVGFVGYSDGWQDLVRHKELRWEYERAENGNVALTGELDLKGSGGEFRIAVGFGFNPTEAGHRALIAVLADFERSKAHYIREWQEWQERLVPLGKMQSDHEGLYRISAMVMRTHEAKRFPGGVIASLSVPWGFAKGDKDLGGYHVTWPRDLVETAGALAAAGLKDDVLRVLHYLHATQEAEGHWPQNMWLDGSPYWNSIQMDETALPIRLIDLARREGALDETSQAGLWPMARRAAGYIVRNGPVTQQDRWEENPGYSPFTLAAEVAALLIAADLADNNKEPETAALLRDTADMWNDEIEHWTYVTGTELSRAVGVEGYYVRISPPDRSDAASPTQGFVAIKNRPPHEAPKEPAVEIVSTDFLALVRFGLRAPDDPRIINTIKVIDTLLKVETPHGPIWRRHNFDGYGEHDDGSPFDGSGVGRAWPLLVGERAHYELAAGRRDAAEQLMEAMESFANEGGFLPEQVWDAPDIPERGLFFGRPSGSSMPLVWAHAEYIKLRRSLRDGKVFDMPDQTAQRYLVEGTRSRYAMWRFNHKRRSIPRGKVLRIEVLARAIVQWSIGDSRTVENVETKDSGLDLFVAEIPTADMPGATVVHFTFYWTEAQRWEGVDFHVSIAS